MNAEIVTINAIAHKDYAAGVPIQISVYDDKLMIWNPGQLPLHWTLDQLTAKHASVPYNPDIASVFSALRCWNPGVAVSLEQRLMGGAVVHGGG